MTPTHAEAMEAWNKIVEALEDEGLRTTEHETIVRSYLEASGEPVAWQPIETAPRTSRNGTILLALPGGRVREGYWGAARYNRSLREYEYAFVTTPSSGDVGATHWRPLPAPPLDTPPTQEEKS